MRLRNVTFMTGEAERLAGFWADALGLSERREGDIEVILADDDWSFPRFTFQRTGVRDKAAQTVHLDLTADDRAREVERLIELGATEIRTHSEPGGASWTVMCDPDGNEFCVAEVPDD